MIRINHKQIFIIFINKKSKVSIQIDNFQQLAAKNFENFNVS